MQPMVAVAHPWYALHAARHRRADETAPPDRPPIGRWPSAQGEGDQHPPTDVQVIVRINDRGSFISLPCSRLSRAAPGDRHGPRRQGEVCLPDRQPLIGGPAPSECLASPARAS